MTEYGIATGESSVKKDPDSQFQIRDVIPREDGGQWMGCDSD